MHVGIIGNGFCGLMTCHHLIKNSDKPISISIFEKKHEPGKGIAYSPQSEKVLLNVVSSKMSAFPDQPTHFVDWLSEHQQYKSDDKELIASSFVPRARYGEYLSSIWKNTVEIASKKNITLKLIQTEVYDLALSNQKISIHTRTECYEVDKVILTTGNQLPRNPKIKNEESFRSPRYFQNPWNYQTFCVDSSKPIFILGNGLTMVDTVIQLREQKISNQIISLSPHGFNILPHRNFSFTLNDWLAKLGEKPTLNELLHEINLQLKTLKKHGISAEPLVDYLRPHTQRLWQNFSAQEKQFFMRKLRHFWGVARHRLPFVTYDIIQKERIQNSLNIISGKIIDIKELNNSLEIEYFDKFLNQTFVMEACMLLNCTGPESDIERTNSTLLKNCLKKGLIQQDDLKLGIKANTNTYHTINKFGEENKEIYTIGSTLRGELWESTAINELRIQAKKLSERILNR